MIEIPGTQLEKAAGEITSEAGKTLIGAIRRRLDAAVAVRSASDEAKAEEIHRDIAHEGEIRRRRDLEEERRHQERKEIAHRVELTELARRGMHRIEEQIIDEQRRLEWIASRSLGIADSDPDRDNAREIPDDWLKRFFKYAADVDEGTILEVLAQCLAAAAIRSRPILSPKALDTLRFFDLRSYHMFAFSVGAMAPFEYLPADMLESEAAKFSVDLDLALMVELGLLKENRQKFATFNIADMVCTFSYDSGVNSEFRVYQLTYVGRSIADLMDQRAARLSKARNSGAASEELIKLQMSLGLNADLVKSLARYLIAQMADTGDCDITVRSVSRGSEGESFSARRSLPIDEFPLAPMQSLDFVDANTKELARFFLTEFEDFNRNQLPYLYTTMKDGST